MDSRPGAAAAEKDIHSDEEADEGTPFVYKSEPLNIQMVILPHPYAFQINSAKQIIAKNHPLSRTPLLKVLPVLYYCRCRLKKPKKDFYLALRKSLLQKMEIKMPKNDLKLEQDPFLMLGKLPGNSA